jgi:methylated-DNA-[protein]-cysteine S-methyltransferase
MDSPLGPICLTGTDQGLTHVDFKCGDRPVLTPPHGRDDGGILAEAIRQLQAYFDGTGQRFTVPLAPRGTPFQQRVWLALQQIPYGTTVTYQELAHQVGRPKGARAVGSANGRNPIAIIIPCHRVLGRDGRLHGYASGLSIKQRLLQHEGAWLS